MKNLSTTICFVIPLLLACASGEKDSVVNETHHALEVEQAEVTRVDSSRFLNFTTGIRAIHEDSDGNTWFASHMEGVCRFDGEEFTYYDLEDGLCHRQVRSIYEDSRGVVWFEGGEGISSYNGFTMRTHSDIIMDDELNWRAGENDLWFKGISGSSSVIRFDGEQLTFLMFPVPFLKDEEYYFNISTPFVKRLDGSYWFGSYGCVIGYDGENFTYVNNEFLGIGEETGYLHVRALFEDSRGNLWIGNNGIGVWMHDGVNWVHFSEEQGLISEGSGRTGGYRSPDGSLEHVFSIGEDAEGRIWFGDRDTGVWCYDGTTMKNYSKEAGLTENHIWQIYTAKNGELWFALGNGQVLSFTGEKFERIF